MIGYRGKFEALGKAAARLDDVLNWVPARLTAGLLLLAGWLLRFDLARGWRILRRDGANTPSPNGGRPMSAMAGLLGVELAKKGVYVLGDRQQRVTAATVRQAWQLVAWSGGIMVVACAAILLVMAWAAGAS
jgi:adenosylcobinamide-phosphate synthase